MPPRLTTCFGREQDLRCFPTRLLAFTILRLLRFPTSHRFDGVKYNDIYSIAIIRPSQGPGEF
jgi:hypothetical protein